MTINIESSEYRAILENGIKNLGLMEILENAPYGFYGPLAHKGGLINYINKCLEIIESINWNPALSKDLMILGCIFRNIGWATTTYFIEQNNWKEDAPRPNNAYTMIGLEKTAFRFINHLIISTESDCKISISEDKKQALENICFINEQDIMTLEGKIVWQINKLVDLLYFGQYTLDQKEQ